MKKALFASSSLIMLTSVMAEDRLEMQGTSIIGNKESPNLLHIVPWKKAEPVSLETPGFDSVLNAPLMPIDRATFQRQVRYYNELYPIAGTGAKSE